MAKVQQQPLVLAHINGAKVEIIERHLECFRKFIGHQKCGIYVLRKDGDIYYVGLASSLRKRLADHIKDHLKGEWTAFDLYMVRKGKAKYLRELEALLIRVAKPRGNQNEPKFVKHSNITKDFEKALHEQVSS